MKFRAMVLASLVSVGCDQLGVAAEFFSLLGWEVTLCEVDPTACECEDDLFDDDCEDERKPAWRLW